LYNFVYDKTIVNLNHEHPLLYEYNDIHQHLKEKKLYNVNDYLKKLYHLILSQFGNMKDFHNDNLTYYQHYDIPSISSIIEFIDQIKPEINQTKIWLKEIKNENVINYFDTTSHYLIISPFLFSYNISNEIYKKIEPIENLWVNDLNNFDYRKINIKDFLRVYNNALNNKKSKENLSNEIIKINFL